MRASQSPTSQHSRGLREPLVLGTLCGLLSAIGYTAANTCLRAVADCDPVWVSCVKAFPTVALFGPFLLVRLLQGLTTLPNWRQLRVLIVAALVCQLLGNVVFQWSLGVIGMALVIPLALGAMIVAATVMGRVVLHEPVTMTMACSILVLVCAVFVLSLGAGKASEVSPSHSVTSIDGRTNDGDLIAATTEPDSVHLGYVLAGVAAACVSGVAYALLGVVIRSVVTDSISVSMTMVTVTASGVVALGAMSLWRPGLTVILDTTTVDFAIMMLAGLFNAAAFLALTKSLQLVPVAYVNALNASQAAMGAMVGIMLFAEPSTWLLWLGVAMTALGLLMMRRPTRVLEPK